jgi:hypothetical protein
MGLCTSADSPHPKLTPFSIHSSMNLHDQSAFYIVFLKIWTSSPIPNPNPPSNLPYPQTSHPSPSPVKASDALSQFEQLLQSDAPPEVDAGANGIAPSVGDVSYTATWRRKKKHGVMMGSGYGSIPMKIPFWVGWTSINPSYFDVNRRGTIGFDPSPSQDWWMKQKSMGRREELFVYELLLNYYEFRLLSTPDKTPRYS